jgi:ornithine cyclodeaminase/alanine dehydrogenase-like protein (mu-crystallin family)
VRTGAASGIATKYLAAPDASVLGVIGTGSQARTQVEAICLVRPIRRVQVYGRDPDRRRAFCEEMARTTGADVVPVESGEAAVRGAQVVTTMTNAAEPVLLGEWLEPGMHVNAAGSNQAIRRELDVMAVQRADRVFADQVETARIESGDLIAAVEAGALAWDAVRGLGEVVAGKRPGRERPEQITLFESQGLAIEDVATATAMYQRAKAEGVGRELQLV